MIEYTIDEFTWFTARQLDYKPIHFVIASATIYDTSLDEIVEWIYNNLSGRFTILDGNGFISLHKSQYYKFAFEDPQEATYFTLRWS